ncbi:MAG: large conductance mechanosensitive channel protein MscL [Lachnospiraceae bacterium]|jgi:large conductance mechanosensitive channel|nr:large conductance mechanosensitive channel protein MscL [Lachnospiraceae bacterium]
MKKMLSEFKTFIMRGNVMDMAVGVIVGSAFTGIVNSLVGDIIMPVITLITGKINFTDLMLPLDGNTYPSLQAARDTAAPVLAYGNFIQLVIQFLLTAFVIFLMVKGINRLHRPAPAPQVTTKICPYCKSEIHKDAVKCPHCASELLTETVEGHASESTPLSE